MSHGPMPETPPPPNSASDHHETRPSWQANGPRQPKLASLFGVLLIAFMIAIVILPLCYTSFSDELGRWRLAEAWEQRLEGQLAPAIECLDAALELNPNHVEIYLQRAAWHDELGNHEAALRDYDKVHELADNDPRMLLGRAITFHRMGKAAESLSDFQLLLDASSERHRAGALNTLAYFRALNNVDLDEALTDIDKSIDLVGAVPALLDTRGFIRYRLGDFEAARSDLDNALADMAEEPTESPRRVENGLANVMDPRVYRLQIAESKKLVAVIFYHRGLVLEKLGETERAQADFAKVRELGFEPSEDLF